MFFKENGMGIDNKLIDELLKEYRKPEDIIGENGLLKQLTKALLERAMNAELTQQLGYEKHDPKGSHSGNSRNGTSSKTLKGDFGEIEIEVPRDRNSSFEPQIVPQHQTRFTGFDDKILSMYARGMTTRDIEGHLKEIYGVEVSARVDLASHGGRDGRGEGVAEPCAGSGIRDCVPGRPVREDAARRAGRKPGRVCGHWGGLGGAQRCAGAVDERQRRGQVLAVGTDGIEEP